MKSFLSHPVRTALLAVAMSTAGLSQAQTSCQQIGNQTYCSGGNLRGAQTLGNSTYYNYNNQELARQQGMPSSSQRLGNTRYYDNGVTQQQLGNTDYFSNGLTKQRLGNTDYYSNGSTCQYIGNARYCN